MIYTRFGMTVKIIGDAGEHKPRYLNFPSQLVRIEECDPSPLINNGNPMQRYAFMHNLKADGGIGEIAQAIEVAPKLKLAAKEKKIAYSQAE